VVFEIEHRRNGVPPRVCRIIVCAIVVDGEIQKLQMAIASGRVQVEKSTSWNLPSLISNLRAGRLRKTDSGLRSVGVRSWLNGIAKCNMVRPTYGLEPSEGL